MKKRNFVVEAALMFFAVMAALWLAPENARVPLFFILGAGVALSWRLRGDSLRHIGIIPESLALVMPALITTGLIVAGIKLLAVAIDAPGESASSGQYLARFLDYLPWALFQQLILCGYFAHRFHQGSGSRLQASLAAGFCFALIHIPNPMLMLVTAFCGPLSAYLFLTNRNLYLLGFLHAAIGASLFFLSGADFYSLRVGPQ